MKRYIFVTPEGLTYKPNCDGPSPDFINMHIAGFGRNSSVRNALLDLIEMSRNSQESPLEGHFSVRIENDNKKSFWVRCGPARNCLAS